VRLGEQVVLLRCLLDGLMLPARLCASFPPLRARDGDEIFPIEAVEARFYELVRATPDEVLGLERARYRLLRRASDFCHDGEEISGWG
jgi:hypothetical protein